MLGRTIAAGQGQDYSSEQRAESGKPTFRKRFVTGSRTTAWLQILRFAIPDRLGCVYAAACLISPPNRRSHDDDRDGSNDMLCFAESHDSIHDGRMRKESGRTRAVLYASRHTPWRSKVLR